MRWIIKGKQNYRCQTLGIVLLCLQCVVLTCFLYSFLPGNTTFHSELLEDAHDASKVFASLGTQLLAVGSEVLKKGGATRIGWNDRAPFAVLADRLPQINTVTKRLIDEGFNPVIFYSRVINKFPPKEKTVPVGVAVKKRYPFYIIFLYNRIDNFWWYGSILKDSDAQQKLELASLSVEDVRTVHREGVFKKVDMIKGTLGGRPMLVPPNVRSWYNFTDSGNSFVECDYERAYNYLKKQGRNYDDTNRFQHTAWKLLSRAQVVMDGLKIPFWLSSGTLLGFYRECGIIPHTTDVDIGVFAKDYSPDIVKEFLFRGFYLKNIFGKVNDSYELSFISQGVKLDIFFFYEEGDTMWNGGTEVTGQKYKYIFPRFDLCWTEFLDLLVRVPCDTLTYIQANYGLDWSEPKLKWDWETNPPNVRENGVWSPDEWKDVLLVFHVPTQSFR